VEKNQSEKEEKKTLRKPESTKQGAGGRGKVQNYITRNEKKRKKLSTPHRAFCLKAGKKRQKKGQDARDPEGQVSIFEMKNDIMGVGPRKN